MGGNGMKMPALPRSWPRVQIEVGRGKCIMLKSNIVRMGLMGSAAALALVGAATSAQAVETSFGDVQIIFDTTVSVGASMRTARSQHAIPPRNERRSGRSARERWRRWSSTGVNAAFLADAALTPVSLARPADLTIDNNVGNSTASINADDGRLNFNSGDLDRRQRQSEPRPTNHVAELQNFRSRRRLLRRGHERQRRRRPVEVDGRRARRRRPQLRTSRRLHFRRLHDCRHAGEPSPRQAGDQLGRKHVHSRRQQRLQSDRRRAPSAVPVRKSRRRLVPVNAFSGSISLPFDVSLSGYYALDWEPFELDPSGTPFSGSDLVTLGGGARRQRKAELRYRAARPGPRRNCYGGGRIGHQVRSTSWLLTDPRRSAL